jgi:hypothetical protein
LFKLTGRGILLVDPAYDDQSSGILEGIDPTVSDDEPPLSPEVNPEDDEEIPEMQEAAGMVATSELEMPTVTNAPEVGSIPGMLTMPEVAGNPVVQVPVSADPEADVNAPAVFVNGNKFLQAVLLAQRLAHLIPPEHMYLYREVMKKLYKALDEGM